MKIRLNLSDLNAALDRVLTVRPMDGSKRISALLFAVHDKTCDIHSYDADSGNYMRVTLPCLEAADLGEGPGLFVFPTEQRGGLRTLKGWIELNVEQGEDQQTINYKTEGLASYKNISTYDPVNYVSMDSHIAEAEVEYKLPTVLFREGLAATSPHLGSDQKNGMPFDVIQLFDDSNPEWAKGNGTFYGGDGNRSGYFHSPQLNGKGMVIHRKYVPTLIAFLAKCGKTVKIRVGENKTFAIDQEIAEDGTERDGAVFGWNHHSASYPRYSYYTKKSDNFVFAVTRGIFLDALMHVRDSMKPSDKEKVQLRYNKPYLKVVGNISSKQVIESVPVAVVAQPLAEGGECGDEFSANANVNALIGLFESAKSNNIELRVALTKERKMLIRTVDRIYLNDSGKAVIPDPSNKETSYECTVTYFSTGMD